MFNIPLNLFRVYLVFSQTETIAIHFFCLISVNTSPKKIGLRFINYFVFWVFFNIISFHSIAVKTCLSQLINDDPEGPIVSAREVTNKQTLLGVEGVYIFNVHQNTWEWWRFVGSYYESSFSGQLRFQNLGKVCWLKFDNTLERK